MKKESNFLEINTSSKENLPYNEEEVSKRSGLSNYIESTKNYAQYAVDTVHEFFTKTKRKERDAEFDNFMNLIEERDYADRDFQECPPEETKIDVLGHYLNYTEYRLNDYIAQKRADRGYEAINTEEARERQQEVIARMIAAEEKSREEIQRRREIDERIDDLERKVLEEIAQMRRDEKTGRK